MRKEIERLAGQIKREFKRRGYEVKDSEYGNIYDCASYLENAMEEDMDYDVWQYCQDTIDNYPEMLIRL